MNSILKLCSISLLQKTKDIELPLCDQTIYQISILKNALINIPEDDGIATNQLSIVKQYVYQNIK